MRALIERFDLQPLPVEGTLFAETYRSPRVDRDRRAVCRRSAEPFALSPARARRGLARIRGRSVPADPVASRRVERGRRDGPRRARRARRCSSRSRPAPGKPGNCSRAGAMRSSAARWRRGSRRSASRPAMPSRWWPAGRPARPTSGAWPCRRNHSRANKQPRCLAFVVSPVIVQADNLRNPKFALSKMIMYGVDDACSIP